MFCFERQEGDVMLLVSFSDSLKRFGIEEGGADGEGEI